MAETALIATHFDRDLTDQEHAELEDWLGQSPDHVRAFVEWSAMESAIEEHFENKHVITPHDEQAFRQLVRQSELSTNEVTATAAVDRDEPWYMADGLANETPPAEENSSRGISFRDATGLLGYAFVQTAKTKPVRRMAAVAAVILVALVAWQIWAPAAPQEDDGQPRALVVPEQTAPQARVVATLTAEYEAVWDRRPGEDLYAGQRFTLIQGFAEITTARGALAFIEAPTTIELLDSDNAIYLHNGKLVGTCETETSEGFLVRTRTMDAVDIGTRFGVDATQPTAIQAHVFEGEIEVGAPAKRVGEVDRMHLFAGQGMVAFGSGVIESISFDPNRFVIDKRNQAARPDFVGTNGFWLGQLSGDLTQDRRQAEGLQVFIESQSFELAAPLAVDMLRGDSWDPEAKPLQKRVSPGPRVDVYLLHFDLAEAHAQPEDFVLDFGRPILGVIATQKGLDGTDATLGVANVDYPKFGPKDGQVPRGLNMSEAGKSDKASIDAEGRTLSLRLWGGNDQSSKMDQLRVIVQALEPSER